MQNRKKQKQEAPQKESPRMFCIAQVGGTIGEKKELAFSLDKGTVTLQVYNFAVVEEKRECLAQVEITNKQALMRFRAMLDTAIKTMQ